MLNFAVLWLGFGCGVGRDAFEFTCTVRDIFPAASERALLPACCSWWCGQSVPRLWRWRVGTIAPGRPGRCRPPSPPRAAGATWRPPVPPGAAVAPSGGADPAGTVPSPPTERDSGKRWWQRARAILRRRNRIRGGKAPRTPALGVLYPCGWDPGSAPGLWGSSQRCSHSLLAPGSLHSRLKAIN